MPTSPEAMTPEQLYELTVQYHDLGAIIAWYATGRAYAGPVQAFTAAGSHYVFGAG